MKPCFNVLLPSLMMLLTATTSRAANLPAGAAFVAGRDGVTVIDLASRTVATTIPAGDMPRSIVLSPQGDRGYVANIGSSNVTAFDAYTGNVLATIPVGSTPGRLAISADGGTLYVPNTGSASLSIIDTAALSVLTTISTPPNPTAVAVHPSRPEIWVGHDDPTTTLRALAATDYSVLASLDNPDRYYASSGLAFNADGSQVLTLEACGLCGRAHLLSGDLSGGLFTVLQQDIASDYTGRVVDGAFGPTTGLPYIVKLGQNGPHRMLEHGGLNRAIVFADEARGIDPTADGLIYVTNFAAGGYLSVVDTTSFGVLYTLPAGAFPEDVAIRPVPEPAAIVVSVIGLLCIALRHAIRRRQFAPT